MNRKILFDLLLWDCWRSLMARQAQGFLLELHEDGSGWLNLFGKLHAVSGPPCPGLPASEVGLRLWSLALDMVERMTSGAELRWHALEEPNGGAKVGVMVRRDDRCIMVPITPRPWMLLAWMQLLSRHLADQDGPMELRGLFYALPNPKPEQRTP
jgi:hypothetical protein